jgi:hypothetical protein
MEGMNLRPWVFKSLAAKALTSRRSAAERRKILVEGGILVGFTMVVY